MSTLDVPASSLSTPDVPGLQRLSLQVCGLAWSPNDSRLVSCGMDGAVYEWDTQTGRRASECVLKSCSYTDVVYSSDCNSVLAVGTDAALKEIQDCQVRDRNRDPVRLDATV